MIYPDDFYTMNAVVQVFVIIIGCLFLSIFIG